MTEQTLPHPAVDEGESRPVWPAIWRGIKNRCPHCGEGRLLFNYLSVHDHCSECGQSFSGHAADDAPPYITMVIVGHLLAVPIVELKRHFDPSLEFQLFLWLGLAISMTLLLLPMSKGGMIGLQWANRMHGFGEDGDDPEDLLRE
ncbi:DUF983 domain-containing protein [Parvularcula sp. LCG005]|uniref:DUF983 domain-containing protein n=1 Tax=Parvularcula sp. LCG005 TaxID=3078805 RepID=UPI002942A308|nr:DUF983 domain-containing protein [Parvularcula sp. LCG005]WOI52270.1 DUF983 domain-containing protein [Parvularcula sp. LCG005]